MNAPYTIFILPEKNAHDSATGTVRSVSSQTFDPGCGAPSATKPSTTPVMKMSREATLAKYKAKEAS